MLPIPEYLRNNAINPKHTKTNIQFDFVCDCNNKGFYIFHNYLTKEEKEIVDEYYTVLAKTFKGSWTYTMELDDKGIVHYYRLYTPLGMYGPKKEVFPPKTPPFTEVNIIKAKCIHCGKEYVLFDSRYHGYDAVTSDESEVSTYIPHFKQKRNPAFGITIKVGNDGSLEEFIENTGKECDEAFYSNAFGSITIYTKDNEGKKKKLFDA